jgi:ferric enterobactin receptor
MYVSQQLTEGCKRFMLSVLMMLFLSVTVMAQNIRVTGKVTDKTGQPIAGAAVVVEGTTIGASTNADGIYNLNAPGSATLLFSFLGLESQKVPVNNRNVINVTLSESSVVMQEFVVTALGIQKDKKALGYAIQDVKSDEILKNKQTNVINSLAGKVAGVNVTQSSGAAGAGSTIIIRGGNSASESRDNQPLFVVDGIIYDNATVNGGNSGTDGVTKTATSFSNRVMDINPEDIENVQ